MESEKKYKVILVDDDDFLINMYATKFNSNNIEIEACKSGPVLIEKLKAGLKAGLILLDIVMPDISGLEALKKIREEKLADDIPIVMLTNQNDQNDINEAKRLDVAGYIVKSAATPSEVVEEVIRIIEEAKK